ncbi:uncharacterized protein JCM6883_000388 [Sporobolomyces salmoneus]|uniref:uncharacterized protein n=1 Tax=Sporobolomyces salmoneus TaxID=183962 RepID=UPI00317DDFDA
MKPLPVKSELPISTPQPRPSSKLLTKRIVLAVVLSLLALVHLVNPQLLFPDQLTLPLRFQEGLRGDESLLDDVSDQRTLRFGEYLDQEGPRIAIIGAGAGGSSAAYFLRHFSALTSRNLSTQVTIYESSDYVGGRSTVSWPWLNDPYSPPPYSGFEEEEEVEPIELGASIFVSVNKNLEKAVRIFGLNTTDYDGEDGETGIWDGEKFVFKEKGNGNWWTKAKLLWRYGRSPFKVKDLVKACVESFTTLYTRPFITSPSFPFTSYLNFSASLSLLSPASSTGSDFFGEQSISPLFTSELISAATQVNYGTPIDQIHGLGALVSLAANGAKSVVGGNRKIFEEFVGRSQAKLKLKTKVKEIVKLSEEGEKRSKWVVRTETGQDGGVYDAVILAAPFHQSSISIPHLSTSSIPPPQPYVSLHVTLVLTNASTPLSSYFSLSPKSTVPNTIFSTFSTSSSSKPRFNSLNYLKRLPSTISAKFDPCNGERAVVHVVKLFSKEELSEVELEGIFGKDNVLKKVEKVWNSYPRLDLITSGKELAGIRLDEDGGLYYVNGMERLISTMETETVSAYNVVSLVMKDLFGYRPPLSWAEWGERKSN